MGTWGLGTFDDDIARDWLEDLHDSDPVAFFRHCLDLTGHDDLEYLACVGVVCTAEIIQGLVRQPREGLPESVHQWLQEHPQIDGRLFLPEAISGLRRVMLPASEMHVLWEDNREMYASWIARSRDLLARLESALADCQSSGG